jgi:hypothetical protein
VTTVETRTFEDYVLAAMATWEQDEDAADIVRRARETTAAVCREFACDMNGGARCIRCLFEPVFVSADRRAKDGGA